MIVLIIDMRIKFNLEPVNYDTFPVVIVLNIGQQVVGMVVDGVSDVITFTPDQLRPVPDFSSTIDHRQRTPAGHWRNSRPHVDIARYRKNPRPCRPGAGRTHHPLI